MPSGPSSWRNTAAPIIAKVLADTKDKSEQERRAALRDAYPFGERKYHPYKIWLSEIKRQLGRPLRIIPAKDVRYAFLGPVEAEIRKAKETTQE